MNPFREQQLLQTRRQFFGKAAAWTTIASMLLNLDETMTKG